LIGVGAGQIQVEPIAWPGPEPAIDVRARLPVIRERLDDFRPDLAATDAKARSYCRDEIVRLRPELLAQRVYSRCRHPLRGAAPPGMSCGNGTRSPVGKQDWSTIGHAHDDRGVGIVADDHVGLW
jgi:hypothetical protein